VCHLVEGDRLLLQQVQGLQLCLLGGEVADVVVGGEGLLLGRGFGGEGVWLGHCVLGGRFGPVLVLNGRVVARERVLGFGRLEVVLRGCGLGLLALQPGQLAFGQQRVLVQLYVLDVRLLPGQPQFLLLEFFLCQRLSFFLEFLYSVCIANGV